MAQLGTNTDFLLEVSAEEEKIEEKRKATDNPDWKVINSDLTEHTAGYMPEEIWILYKVGSSKITAI